MMIEKVVNVSADAQAIVDALNGVDSTLGWIQTMIMLTLVSISIGLAEIRKAIKKED